MHEHCRMALLSASPTCGSSEHEVAKRLLEAGRNRRDKSIPFRTFPRRLQMLQVRLTNPPDHIEAVVGIIIIVLEPLATEETLWAEVIRRSG